ncbi:MAG: hypothetical protein Gaeavirus33_2 [Gaeavirus sp.]|uniref:Uncharacterized protein n=1 Tax=Gaeavirus sp. TaxID=2487767 RepID=A0A3G5A2B3_9VIRU|nr:MAG: hypothetical protein Gaeavirus33_2 [Gaeavirus sp.]
MENIIANITNTSIKNIFKTLSPFIIKKIKYHNYNINKTALTEFTNNIKQLDKLYLSKNTSSKKLLNIILHRYILSNNVNESNYNKFFLNNIIEDDITGFINFDKFIKLIPTYKQHIINLKISDNIKHNLNIHITKVIEFITKDYNFIKISQSESGITMVNNKRGGKILITESKNNLNDLNIYQQNINLICFNVKELKDTSFFKKTNNFITIECGSFTIDNLSTLLHITHLITCAIKLLESYPSTIYECLYPIDYNKYYYKTFVNFLSFIKNKLNTDYSYNRFMIDLIKYYYIYSYYDYYFYFDTKFIKTIIDRISYKTEIFDEFCSELKSLFKLPSDMDNYPPFFKIDDNIDDLIYYSIEIPNYFKFYDLLNALIYVFGIEITDPTNIDIMNIVSVIKLGKQTIPKKVNVMPADDNNAFIELNIENSENYALMTEINE